MTYFKMFCEKEHVKLTAIIGQIWEEYFPLTNFSILFSLMFQNINNFCKLYHKLQVYMHV
jgi:hypothetical protein